MSQGNMDKSKGIQHGVYSHKKPYINKDGRWNRFLLVEYKSLNINRSDNKPETTKSKITADKMQITSEVTQPAVVHSKMAHANANEKCSRGEVEPSSYDPTIGEVLRLNINKILEIVEWKVGIDDFEFVAKLLTKATVQHPKSNQLRMVLSNFNRRHCVYVGKNYDLDEDKMMETFRNLIKKESAVPLLQPVDSLILPFTPEELRQFHFGLIKHIMPTASTLNKSSLGHTVPSPISSNTLIRIGYLTSWLEDRTMTHLIQAVIREHDKSKFQLVCLSTKTKKINDDDDDDDDNFQKQLYECHCTEFYNVPEKLKSEDSAAFISRYKLDILVDMNGPHDLKMASSFFLKPAPIIITWFGYPGGSGNPSVDYVVVDKMTCPWPDAQAWFVEKCAFLQNSYFICDHAHVHSHLKFHATLVYKGNAIVHLNCSEPISNAISSRRNVEKIWDMIQAEKTSVRIEGMNVFNGKYLNQDIPMIDNEIRVLDGYVVSNRRQYGISDDAIVYANFNPLRNIDKAWILSIFKILNAVPNSVLWLVESPAFVVMQLRDFLNLNGLNNDRLIISSHEIMQESHVRKGVLVDIMLDPFISNGQMTSLDGLWSGTPLITLQGNAMHRRITSSLLHVLQLPALITTSIEEFTDRAIWLGQNPKAVSTLRELINLRKLIGPLFNVKQFTADLEDLYLRMHSRHLIGNFPDHLLPQPNYEDWRNSEDEITFEKLKIIVDGSLQVLYNTTPLTTHAPFLSNPQNNSSLSSITGTRYSPLHDSATLSNGLASTELSELSKKEKRRKEVGGHDPDGDVDSPISKRPRLETVNHTMFVGEDLKVDKPSDTGSFVQFTGYAKGSRTAKFVSFGEEYKRIPIKFEPPTTDIIKHHGDNAIPYYHGQRGVNFVYLESAVKNVLDTMTSSCNMEELCMGPIQANQFMNLLEEYFFEDGLPAMPKTLSDCPNFYRDPKGLIFQNDRQYAWMHSFFDREGWENNEPKFGKLKILENDEYISNMFDLKWDGDRRKIRQNCRLCPVNDKVNAVNGGEGPSCYALCLTHYQEYHNGSWIFKSDLVKNCLKCGKNLAPFDEESQARHIKNHYSKPICAEEYFDDSEIVLSQSQAIPFAINLNERFVEAAQRYVNEAAAANQTVRKYHKLQKLTTFTTWLVPACQLVLTHMKRNPSKISGTSFIGYQFKSLLQCHLKTRQPLIVSHVTSIPSDDRLAYAKASFKFLNKDLMCKLLRAFEDKHTMNENNWEHQFDQLTKDVTQTEHDFQPQCKFCGTDQTGASRKFIGLVKKDHLLPEIIAEGDVCQTCGYYFYEEINKEQIRMAHATAHSSNSCFWKEMLVKVVEGTVTEMPVTEIRIDVLQE